MGRELNRKQAKKEGKNIKEIQNKNKDKPLEVKTFIVIIVSMLLCFILIYILTGIFVTKEIKWFDKKENNPENINTITNRILAQDSLRQSESTYYVYYYESKNEHYLSSSAVNKIKEKVYRVDLSDDFNSNFKSTSSSGIVSNISDLKVVSPSVIKVVDGMMTELYSGSEEIVAAFK